MHKVRRDSAPEKSRDTFISPSWGLVIPQLVKLEQYGCSDMWFMTCEIESGRKFGRQISGWY